MKKILSLALIGILCLALTGCGNSDDSNDNDDNNQNNNCGNVYNGTPPTVKAPLENHAGDKNYFYMTTDDYVVYTNTKTWDNYSYIDYTIQSFGTDGFNDVKGSFKKLVFENNNQAKEFADDKNGSSNVKGYITIDNAVYVDKNCEGFDFTGLGMSFWESKYLLIDYIKENNYDHYISKP